MTSLTELWTAAIAWLADHGVIPVVQSLGIAQAAGDPREIAEAVLIAALQLLLIAGVMRPLESLIPAERWAPMKSRPSGTPARRKPSTVASSASSC